MRVATFYDLPGIPYFVSLKGIEALETGIQNLKQEVNKSTSKVESEAVDGTYFAAAVGNKLLILLTPSATPLKDYEGALVSVPFETRSYFYERFLKEKNRKYEDVFLPYMLNTSSFRSDAYIGLAICVPIALLALWNVKKAVSRMGNFELSPIYKSLAHFDRPVENVAQVIDQEVKTGPGTSNISGIVLTTSWLLRETFFQFWAIHLAEIVWVYQKETRHSVNFIPTGKSYAVVIRDKWGRTVEKDIGRGTKDTVTGFIIGLSTRLPGIVVGYSDELKKLYEKNRAAFVKAVEAKRYEMCNRTAATE